MSSNHISDIFTIDDLFAFAKDEYHSFMRPTNKKAQHLCNTILHLNSIKEWYIKVGTGSDEASKDRESKKEAEEKHTKALENEMNAKVVEICDKSWPISRCHEEIQNFANGLKHSANKAARIISEEMLFDDMEGNFDDAEGTFDAKRFKSIHSADGMPFDEIVEALLKFWEGFLKNGYVCGK